MWTYVADEEKHTQNWTLQRKSMGEGFHLAINLNGQCLFDTLFTVWLCSFTNQLTICSILNVTSFVFIIQAVPNERLLLN